MTLIKEGGKDHAGILKAKFRDCSAKVAVIGLGYVGLPLAVLQAGAGFVVTGIDRDVNKVGKVNRGESYIRDVDGDELRALVNDGKLRAFPDYGELAAADVIIICVPTPLKSMRQPDLSHVIAAVKGVAARFRPGRLITLESTTFPGTTGEVVLPLLESGGRTAGRDFFLAFSPERVDPGNKRFAFKDISKVVGGVTDVCREVACAFYSRTFARVVPVSSPAAAEMTKIFENTYRSVNIALVNEFMILCDRMGLDIWEVVEAAATKPFGFQTFYPGPGVGGHCIPVDPVYLSWKAREYNFPTRFIDLAAEINMEASAHVIRKLIAVLNRHKKCLNGSRILVLGIAYKKDIEDTRESPALRIIGLLRESGAGVIYHDPYVPDCRLPGEREISLHSVELTEELVAGADCVLILTDHSCVDYQWIADHARLILDARNATKSVTRGKEKVVKI